MWNSCILAWRHWPSILSLCALFSAVGVNHTWAQQSTVLFQSDGSSLSSFSCEASNIEYSPPFIDFSDGLAPPSIEFDTTSGVQVSFAPYVLPSLEPGQTFHGTVDVKAEIPSRVPVLAHFGVAIDPAGCNFPQTRRPIPEFRYVFDGGLAGNVQTWLTRQDGDVNTPINTPFNFTDGAWHAIDVTVEAKSDGSQMYILRIDGAIVVQGSAYADLGLNENLGVMIGATASGGPTNVRYDNIKVELLEDAAGPVSSEVEANPNPVAVTSSSTLSANVDDTTTGGNDIASAHYTIDGGSPVGMSVVDSGFDEVSEDVTAVIPAQPTGVYEVCVRGTDAVGNVGDPECILLPVYDPSGGFVTGGGWIYSDPGFCSLNNLCTNAEGKANFGFVSKYKKGANVPSGQTEFQFKAGDLNFHSAAYDWLVISGPMAQFKGSGTINGGGDYGFLLTAQDSAINGGPPTDTFRIKIWDKATETIVYDNGTNQGLGGGSIVIHAK